MSWSLDICSTQHPSAHRVQMHGASHRDTDLYPPHNNSSVYLTTTTTYMLRSGWIIGGMRSSWKTLRDSVRSSSALAPASLEWSFYEQGLSSLTISAPVSDVSVPACTNGVCPPLRPASVAQINKPSTMMPSNVQSIDLLMDCTA